MSTPAKFNRPHIVAVVGGSGNGKSTWLQQQIARDKRVLVWDPKNEYRRQDESFQMIYKKSELISALRRCPGKTPGRYAFVPHDMRWFGFWAEAAHAWGHATVVAEETSDVTSPGKAPLGWGMVLRRGGDQGLRVYATTQRPAESDKTIWGNRTLVHCHLLPRPDDRRYMAREMGIDQSVLDTLRPFDWVEIDQKGTLTRGKVVQRNKK